MLELDSRAFNAERRLIDGLERDKERLEKKRDCSDEKILSLSVMNERLKWKVKHLEDDVQSLRSKKEHRENGILILTVLCAVSQLFFLHWLSMIVFYCFVLGILCFIVCLKICRFSAENVGKKR